MKSRIAIMKPCILIWEKGVLVNERDCNFRDASGTNIIWG